MDRIKTLIDLCATPTPDLDAIERYIESAPLNERAISIAAYGLLERCQDEVAVYRYHHHAEPSECDLVSTALPDVLPILVRHGLTEEVTAINSDGGECTEALHTLLDWLDNRKAAAECARRLGLSPLAEQPADRGEVPLFQSTKNTRPILSDSMKYIRSDVPTAVTASERDRLLAYGITTVVDLRTERERAAKPCPLATDDRFTYITHPVTGGDRIPASPDAVGASYIAMADDALVALAKRLVDSPKGVLYFCNAGKDRTGVLSALILCELGAPREEIVADYMKSRKSLADALAAYAAAHPEINPATITPSERYIGELLEWYGKKKK